MQPTVSFVPLAARLAAHAAAIRPVDGTRDDWSNVGALLVCLLLEFLICLCEALDARAAAVAGTVAASGPRKCGVTAVPSPRQALPYGLRAPRLALAPDAQAITSDQADAPFGIIGAFAPAGPRLVWSRDPGPVRAVPAPPWRPHRETRPLRLQLNTSVSLRYHY